MRLKYSLSVLFLNFICFYSFLFAQETLTITTYYPSPYGSYRELRSQRIAIGDTYNNISTVCWGIGCGGATIIPDTADLVVEGNVGIGTASPTQAKLHIGSYSSDVGGEARGLYVQTNTINVHTAAFLNADGYGVTLGGIGSNTFGTIQGVNLTQPAGHSRFVNLLINLQGGNVGIGTTSPANKLDVEGGLAVGATYSGTSAAPMNGAIIQGNVGIGTTTPVAALDVVGGIRLDIAASPPVGSAVTYILGQRELRRDLAELFDTSEDVEAGDVLCITTGGKLKKSNKSYDTSVAGIVSEAPAIIFEGNRLQVLPQPYKFTSGRKPPLALAGRVLCKVITSNGEPIKVGDLLVTSSKPGYAMKGDPKKIQIGTVLGKAMEPLEKGEGKIIVLVTLQ